MSECVIISKNLKPWVKGCAESMNLAYDECWRQKELLEKAIWTILHEELGTSPVEIKTYIESIKKGDKESIHDKAIAECISEWK